MSAERAFKLKQPNTGPRIEAERTELLRDLETDYREVEAFTTALNFVTSQPPLLLGLLRSGKVEALFNPEYSPSGNLKFKGELVQIDGGEFIPKRDVESTGFPNLRPESRGLILDTANARMEAVSETSRSAAEVEAFTTALNFVTSQPPLLLGLLRSGKVLRIQKRVRGCSSPWPAWVTWVWRRVLSIG